MKHIDFIIQSLLIGAATVCITGSVVDAGLLSFFLIIQFVIGFWQFFGSLFTIIANVSFRKERIRHFVLACIYLLLLVIAAKARWLPEGLSMIIVFIPAWALAIYYYVITWRWTFNYPRKKGGFLHHLSF